MDELFKAAFWDEDNELDCLLAWYSLQNKFFFSGIEDPSIFKLVTCNKKEKYNQENKSLGESEYCDEFVLCC